MSAAKPPETQPPAAHCVLTEAERRALRDLVDELIEATEDRVFWLGPVRETALEMQRRLGALLDTEEE
ncbi:hypothetical protein [Streptomonospora litoralis]|uniref:Uncharacterized protein n=1 Tax=Streptomonospora litoralis TaxID=2498135 RepID=A0A4P6Q1G0_9ACTN|nr:hypothetical protein [Streptomonospora litoralis]QBI52544.1 hypothetical protein EKD16_03670 [Streptomonospora litoralis]